MFMARHETAETEARLTTEPCGELGIWIYIDGKLMDLIHYSDLLYSSAHGHSIVNSETRKAIQAIYDDITLKAIAGEEE